MQGIGKIQDQEFIDRFYWEHANCCAGCDHWRPHNSLVGECTRSAMVSGEDRLAALGIVNQSMPVGAGHVATRRDHVCGAFVDEFDWSSLPMSYQLRVGAPTRK